MFNWGAGPGRTVTVKAQMFVPELLLAVQVTTFVPSGKEYGEVMADAPRR